MGVPTLIVVSGPAGSGKTTLAHELARAVGCPALCRDEIKEGMVASRSRFVAAPGDPLTVRTYGVFFEVIALLLRAEVTLVAEAAFQHAVWWRGLEPLAPMATLRVVRCHVAPVEARARMSRRLDRSAVRAAHADVVHLEGDSSFDPLQLEAPTLDVDTTDGWSPPLTDVVGFCRGQDHL